MEEPEIEEIVPDLEEIAPPPLQTQPQPPPPPSKTSEEPSQPTPHPEEATEPQKAKDLEEDDEETPLFIEASAIRKLPYNVHLLESVYGEGQRGVVATVAIRSGTLIHREDAVVYIVSPSHEGADPFFDGSEFAGVPEELRKVPDGDKLEMTCLLIEEQPSVGRFLSHPVTGLHGRIQFNGRDKTTVLDELHAYFVKRCPDCVASEPEPATVEASSETSSSSTDANDGSGAPQSESAADKNKWTRDQFLRLFAVVCLNAVRPCAPMSGASFGTALFRATALFNHSCTPNAVIMYHPGKAYLIAIADILPGEEITVAYTETPRDLLNENLVTLLHYDAGVVSVESGACRCATCCKLRTSASNQAAAAAAASTTDATDTESKADKGQEEEEIEEVHVDTAQFLSEQTLARFTADKNMRTAFTIMFKYPTSLEAVKAAYVWFDKYKYSLLPPTRDADGVPLPPEILEQVSSEYMVDVAYILGDIFCTRTIHYPEQDPEVIAFWADVYLTAMSKSAISMPHSIETAILAALHACIVRHDLAPENSDTRRRALFDVSRYWVAYTDFHTGLYGHVAYTTLACKAHPYIGHMVVNCADYIRVARDAIKLENARQQSVEQKAREDALAEKLEKAEAALSDGTAPLLERD